MNKMYEAVKARWVAALRSGEYKQGRKFLRPTPDTFCCLGVLCNLHAQDHPAIAAKQRDIHAYLGRTAAPHERVLMWAGLKDSTVVIGGKRAHLDAHNDRGRTFAEIADAIEAQL